MAVPRWKTILDKALAKNPKQTAFQLATLDGDASRFNVTIIPRVRSHLYRQFLTTPNAPLLPIIISSTDIRSPKVTQLTETSTKCELAWWLESSIQQVRIIADVYLIPESKHPLFSKFLETLRNAPTGSALAAFKDKDWEAHRAELFRSMSAHMKASWCRPAPGTKLHGGEDEAKNWPVTVEDPEAGNPDKDSEEYEKAKRLWDIALSNFATVIIDPLEVDFIDLGVVPNVRSLFRKRIGAEGVVWEEEDLVP